MPRTHHRTPLAAFALALLVALVPASLAAQEPTATTMVIEVPDPDQPDYLPGSSNLDYFGGRFAVFADGALCVDGDVPADGGAFFAVLGEAGQPEECGTPGARVEFAGKAGGPFHFETVVTLGATATLNNWAPYPTHTPFPLHVCAWLAEQGVEVSGCQMIGGSPGSMVVWQFAPKFIFGDERTVISLVSLMDGVPFGYAQPVAPANGDELLLLQASGTLSIDEELQVAETRTCRVWYPDDPDAPGFVGLSDTLTEEFVRVFDDLGLDITPCERTAEAEAADLLLWREEEPPPLDFSAFTMDGSFLVSTWAPPPPSGTPAAPGAPAPAPSGNAGLVTPSQDRGVEVIALLMLGLTLAGAVGARAIARR